MMRPVIDVGAAVAGDPHSAVTRRRTNTALTLSNPEALQFIRSSVAFTLHCKVIRALIIGMLQGIWRDLAVRKRKTEVAVMFAPVLAAARQHGVDVRTVERLDAMIAEMENGTRDFSPENLAELGR